ncbi:MAG: sigma-70 family RNA polymerase sigma factor [Verrucomicrobiota bacterium]
MTDSANPTAQQDESAVAAVRGGDAERYRELVERHERRVYAVAWSRLGDAALAEEVTQEAFIRAYRRLWLLGDGAKFSGWVNTIARRVAINFGLRHRRELNKRERWALEIANDAAGEPPEADPVHTPETLRQTLAELPPAHRECLVLFYLEGKSGAEVAAALGITEVALRVRLLRARAAMRERLEEKLVGSLTKLRPTKSLVPVIMASVLASSSAKAATAGSIGVTILGTLAKFTPFKWLFLFLAWLPLFLPAIMILPGLFLQRWQRRDEQRNFRDQKGFRANLHQQINPGFLVVSLSVIGMFLLYLAAASRVFGAQEFFLILGLFMLAGLGFAARQLQINRSRLQFCSLFANLVMCAACLSVAAGWMPVLTVAYASFLSSFLTVFPQNSRLLRMDYNLFLRAMQGMLPPINAPAQKESSTRFDRSSLRAFARFLGERQLVTKFRWGKNGLTLYMHGVKSPLMTTWNRIFPSVRDNSNLTLGWDGLVAAHCGRIDAAGLEVLRSHSTANLAEMENQVALAVTQAWRNFQAGNFTDAERAIGQVPDAEIFVVPPTRTRAQFWLRIFFGGMLTVSLLLIASVWLFSERFSGMKPVNLTEAQVREFFSLINTNPNPIIKHIGIDGKDGFAQKAFQWDPFNSLSGCLLLPETNLFTPKGIQAIHATAISSQSLEVWRRSPQSQRVQGVLFNSKSYRALLEGWLSWQDLDLQPADCEAYLHTNRFHHNEPKNWDRFFSRGESWSWVKSERFPVIRIQSWGVNELRFLRAVNSLDLVDRKKITEQIASVQTLSAKPLGQPPIHDWKDVRGLFFTPCWPALLDTYYSLAALEAIGGLDKIDREACIRGILRVHRGKGFFDSPDSGNYNEYHIDGNAQDTIAAYESLRILGALDRVKDLDKWQFRVNHRHLTENEVTWRDIEAWVATQRLEKILREHKAHPSAAFPSLLKP